MKRAHRARLSLIAFAVTMCLLSPAVARAQLAIYVVPTEEFVVRPPILDIPLIRFLAEGATLRAETRRSTDVVLFVARASDGKVMAQGQTSPFRLDAKAASTSKGMLLGSAVSVEQLLKLPPINGLGEAVATVQASPEKSVSATELIANPGAAFGLPGLNPGIFDQQPYVLLVAVVPADPAMRERTLVMPLFVGVAGT